MKKRITSEVESNLQVGDSTTDIVEFLEKQKWIYDFDRHLNRFQARLPDKNAGTTSIHKYQIYLYVDDEGRFSRFDVVDVFNSV
ncbi:hypothetical protein [Alteromonas sp. ASW11-130]|uniref:hypothetical protein n=1 Tax=Alteromonas sp. ASW11-130 TaxID=3015775 RepID=UPI00224280BE|nr:hypothetical protein [Alteromonas sp. ASW11-130]MCW8091133.1 hypothetical protein [Alteromonas sp. ASW11-130]